MRTFKQYLIEKIESAFHPSLDIHPGKEFRYTRNTVSSKEHTKHLQGDPYKQKIEPAGRYLQAVSNDHTNSDPQWESGTHTFHNPLYVHWGSGSYSDADNWKNVLHQHYKRKGKHLSQAIRNDGHDGIVTVGHDPKMPHYTSEVVDLSMFKPK